MKKLNINIKQILLLFLMISFVGCEEKDDEMLPAVTAEFTYSLNSETGTARFINTSENASSYTWNFGNGNTSTEVNPIETFEEGSYTVTLTAKSSSGATDSFEDDILYTIIDTQVPVITLLGDATINHKIGTPFTDPGATASDDVNGDVTSSIVVGGDVVDVNTAGTYTITYNVSDASGNTATEVTRTVIVAADTIAPVITLLGSATINITLGDNGWGNNELQYYTDRNDNISVQNGKLLITANQEDYQGSSYTSARILTKGKFDQKYGRFEARIKVPYGQGIWPAFWLLGDNIDQVGWPQCGEIDIMEYRGQEPTLLHGSIHGPGYSGGNPVTKTYELINDRFDTGFHIFGIEWGPKYINYYVDDVLYNQITPADADGEWVFDHPFYIIINLAVGGSFAGSPNAETVFPQTMLVDYVRVYKSNQ